VQVVDTTTVGDAFVGGLAAALAAGEPSLPWVDEVSVLVD